MTAFSFDATKVEPDTGRMGPVPAGYYKVVIDNAELKPTKNGDGSYINARSSILEGAYKGQKIFHKFNVTNPNDKAVEIGYKQLSALCHALGVMQMQALEQMYNIPHFVKVKVKDGENGYDAQNEITAFRGIGDQAANAAYAAQSSGPSAAPGVTRTAVPPVVAPVVPTVQVGQAPAWQAPAAVAAPAPAWQPPVQPPAVQAPPVQAPAAAAPAPAWTPPANVQPWQQPTAPAVAAQPEATPVVEIQPPAAGEALPPWMTQPAA